jgi:[ribosomal protein S5]-alanine N-acetyltransferase
MTTFLETKRLIINKPDFSDIEDLYVLQSDPDVMQYIGQGVRSRDEVLSGLEKAINHQAKHGFSLGSVYEKDTGKFIGRAGLIYLAYDDAQPDIEVGYALIKAAWGKGYATELAKALIDWGFKHLAVEKMIAVTHPKNDRSRHVVEKANMHYVGLAYHWNNQVARYEILKPDFS